MGGIITDIQRFSLNDGPGIRTTVFLKGCPLTCLWCHNPETQSPLPEARRRGDGTEDVFGREATADEIIAEVLLDKAYYDKSGGGLTLSGGEPLYQPAFAKALLQKAKENGLHTCLETALFAKEEAFLPLLPLTDLFLVDWKLSDSALHQKYTGAGNELILSNIISLSKRGAPMILRCPIIPTINNSDAHFDGIARLIKDAPAIIGIELMAYHNLGANKYRETGREYALPALQILSAGEKETICHAIAGRVSKPVKWG